MQGKLNKKSRLDLVPITVLRGHENSVNCVRFINENDLVSGCSDGKVRLWSLSTRRCAESFVAHSNSVQSICVMTNGIATSGRDGFIRLWDTSSLLQKPSTTIRTGCQHFCNATIDESTTGVVDSNLIVSSSADTYQILLWDVRTPQSPVLLVTGEKSAEGQFTRGMVTSLLLRSDLRLQSSAAAELTDCAGTQVESYSSLCGLVAGYEDGSVGVLDMRSSGKMVASAKLHSQPVFALGVCPRGKKIVSGSADSFLRRTRLTAYQNSSELELSTIDSCDLSVEGSSCVRYRPDSRLLVSTHWDHSVRLFDDKKMKPLAVLRHHRETVNSVDFAPHSATFATASKDCTIAIWSLYADSYTI